MRRFTQRNMQQKSRGKGRERIIQIHLTLIQQTHAHTLHGLARENRTDRMPKWYSHCCCSTISNKQFLRKHLSTERGLVCRDQVRIRYCCLLAGVDWQCFWHLCALLTLPMKKTNEDDVEVENFSQQIFLFFIFLSLFSTPLYLCLCFSASFTSYQIINFWVSLSLSRSQPHALRSSNFNLGSS